MIHKVGSLGRYGGPILVDRVITNSVVCAISDSVKTASGFAALGTAGAAVLGHVVAIVGQDGLNPENDGSFNGNLGTAYTAASDNQTVAQVKAVVDVDTYALYSAEVDATIGTTTGSDLAGYYMKLVDEDTLDESTAATARVVLSEGTPNTVAYAQYATHGADRNNTAQALVNICYSEVFGV